MEKVIINFNGDIHIHVNMPFDMFDDFEDDDFDEEASDKETACEASPDGMSLSVSGIPSEEDRKTIEAIMEVAMEVIKSVLDQENEHSGDSHEGV